MTVRQDFLDDSEDENRLIIRHAQDVAPILEANKRYSQELSGYTPSRDMKHIARIPLIILQLWADQHGENAVKDPAFIKRMLNSSEWSYLRTGQGRV